MRVLIFSLAFLFVTPSYGGLKSTLKNWVGADKATLVSVWGYPERQDHIVKLDDTLTLTYKFPGCTISFTLKKDKVIHYRWRTYYALGYRCPKYKRPKKEKN